MSRQTSKVSSKGNGPERRRVPRRAILDSFSVFLTIDSRGGARVAVHDLSELGIQFDADVEGEGATAPLEVGEELEVQLYLNQSLYLPLRVRIARIVEDPTRGVRMLGAEVLDSETSPAKALADFVRMLDHLGASAQVRSEKSKT